MRGCDRMHVSQYLEIETVNSTLKLHGLGSLLGGIVYHHVKHIPPCICLRYTELLHRNIL